MEPTRIALVGDFNPDELAHQAINRSVALSAGPAGDAVEPVWIGTEKIVPGDEGVFQGIDGVWCVPASPYRNTAGALWAIQFARTRLVPFLGTCGGFQHALLEYARNVHGLAAAEHQELRPEAEVPLLNRLRCSLVEKSQNVRLTGQGKFGEFYGADSGRESYHCSYGLNPDYEHLFESGAMEITARSEEGEVRAIEL